MAPRIPVSLLLLVTLAACGPAPSPSKPAATPRPKASASAKAAPPTPKPVEGTGELLRAPSGARTIAGTITIEAAYALRRGAVPVRQQADGKLISDAGGGILAVGARPDATGRLIGDAGGGVLATGGFAIAARAGGTAATSGGLLLAGAPVLANNGGGYRLAQASVPAAGVERPVAGMLVGLVRLSDRSYVPIGQDAAGKPVYGVYSDAEGRYQLFVAPELAGNVMVVAGVPGGTDPKLSYNLLTRADAASAPVDELGRLTTRYIREGFTRRLSGLLRAPELAKALLGVEPRVTEPARVQIGGLIDTLLALGKEAGYDAATAEAADLDARTQAIIDAGLVQLDLDQLLVNPADIARPEGQGRSVFAIYREVLDLLLQGAAKNLAADPDAYSQAFLADRINAPHNGDALEPLAATYEIQKPSDVGDFMLAEYTGNTRQNSSRGTTRLLRYSLGELETIADNTNDGRAYPIARGMDSAGYQTIVALARRFAADPELRARVRAILAAR